MSTKGVQICRENRKDCQNLPQDIKDELGRLAIQIIYAPNEAVRAARHRALAKFGSTFKRLAESEAAEKAR